MGELLPKADLLPNPTSKFLIYLFSVHTPQPIPSPAHAPSSVHLTISVLLQLFIVIQWVES